MSKGLVIVESPAKAKTIQKYLGKGFSVEASLGHVKDLPKSTLGVDITNNFDTDYVIIPGKEKVVAKLKKLAASADAIYLAPDPDREGEAIAAHLADELDETRGKKKKAKKGDPDAPPRIQRVTFNEITKRAVQAAFEHPRAIDQNLVDAQQARRVLDRLVGYQVSPLLWDKVRRGLSAGRVQTVALRLIVEREREIKAFEKKEYWTLDAHLAAAKPPAFDARFLGKNEEKVEISNGEEAEKIRTELERAEWIVRSVDKKERRRNAAPPFTTSKLQQRRPGTGVHRKCLQHIRHHALNLRGRIEALLAQRTPNPLTSVPLSSAPIEHHELKERPSTYRTPCRVANLGVFHICRQHLRRVSRRFLPRARFLAILSNR